jgi:uncharacterized protein YsxB (DUF464 family)
MIRITRVSPVCVTLEGHALSDVYGKDLICAAVSALALTLAANVEGKEHAEVSLQPGNSRISCHPEAAGVFDCVCKGFRLLADQFPECVCYLEVRID